MRRASIDIGSNSVLLLAVQLDNDGKILEEVLNESVITSLGKDLDVTKKFHPDSMSATFEALKHYKKLLDEINFPLSEVLVTATEASRVSTNSRDFFKIIKNELGFDVSIISSEAEAYYTALGVVSSLNKGEEKNIVVMDIGGASTELIQIQVEPFLIKHSLSLPVGSVRATDWKRINQFEFKMSEILDVDLSAFETLTLVCVAGSMTALASVYLGQRDYLDSNVEGMSISFKNFVSFSQDLQQTSIENLLLLFPFLGKRAPMISGGARVAELIGNKLKIDTIKISTRGLRYGVVIAGGIDERFIRN